MASGERRGERPDLRRRHGPQRHARARPAPRPPSALRRRPDRGPLSLQQAGHAGPARGPGRRWRLRREAARLLVAPGPGRRPAARPLQPAHPQAVRRRGGALRGRLRRRPGRACRRLFVRPALAARRRRRASRARRDELAQRQGGADAAAAVPGGALRPRGPRRPRRRLVGDHQDLGTRAGRRGDRLVGRSPARDRGRGARRGGRRRLRAAARAALRGRPRRPRRGRSRGGLRRGCSTSSGWTTTRRCGSSSTTR